MSESKLGAETRPSDIKGSPFTSVNADLSTHPEVVNWAARRKAVPPALETKDTKSDSAASKKVWEYTIGDLHGNAALCLWHALRAGAVKFGEKASYEEFWKIYEAERKGFIVPRGSKKPFPSEERQQFEERYPQYREILKKLELNDPDVMLRFLGDLFFDRGANDLLTLLLIKRFKELGVKPTIIASNHDLYFLSVYEQAKRDTQNGDGTLKENMLKYHRNKNNQGPGFESGRRLITALQEGFVTEAEFQDLVETYKSCLRAVDYSFVPAAESETGADQTRIYMHAAVGVEAIRFYADYFGITYQEGTVERLRMIDEINAKFQQAVRDGADMIALYNAHCDAAGKQRFGEKQDLEAGDHARTLESQARNTFIQEHFAAIAKENPLVYACEARGEDPTKPKMGDTAPKSNLHMIEVPKNVLMIHGHHAQSQNTANKGLYSLDQEFGKDNQSNGYIIKGTVFVHEQEVARRQEITASKGKTYATQKKIAYGIGSLGFIGSIGMGVTFTIRASVPEKDLADFFLKVPDLSRLTAGGATGVGIGLVILFIASVVVLVKGHQLDAKQKSEEKGKDMPEISS